MVIWSLMTAVSIYGIMNVETNFTKEYFIPRGTSVEKYFNLLKKYYDYGLYPTFMIVNAEIDFSSKEIQYELLDWYDNIQRCYLCE